MGDINNARKSKSWAFEQAENILRRYENNARRKDKDKGYILFETGYGPSGLPHIGTFGEVARTSMVRAAFHEISDIPTRLICFSDDMDGLRKVPDNLPDKEMIEANLGKPLTAIPDPFGTHESFGAHMNNRLQEFLDAYGFDYEFKSATECYKSGEFDNALLNILQNYEEVVNVILPTLGEERQQTYSPFLPVDPDTGKVLQAKVTEINPDAGSIKYTNESGNDVETKVTGGACKLQWKADWAMRWYALDVDYEMSGKDLAPSVQLSSRITSIMGGKPPEGFTYEMFLDENGEKISKSKGNGLSIEEWLTYAPQESLAYYMYQSPRKAKKLHFDVIPKSVDEYLSHLSNLGDVQKNIYDNPAWFVNFGKIPSENLSEISFNLLLNLASAAGAEDKEVMWGFISQYDPNATPENSPMLDKLAGYAVKYYEDFIKPYKKYKTPDAGEKTALENLKKKLENLSDDSPVDEIQTIVFSVGKEAEYENLREWFKLLYETLLGQEQGPRMGSFIALYGRMETIKLIDKALDR